MIAIFPRPLSLVDALRIAGDPRPDDSLSQRKLAWCILMSAKGNIVRQSRLQ